MFSHPVKTLGRYALSRCLSTLRTVTRPRCLGRVLGVLAGGLVNPLVYNVGVRSEKAGGCPVFIALYKETLAVDDSLFSSG